MLQLKHCEPVSQDMCYAVIGEPYLSMLGKQDIKVVTLEALPKAREHVKQNQVDLTH